MAHRGETTGQSDLQLDRLVSTPEGGVKLEVTFISGGIRKYLTASTTANGADLLESLVRDLVAEDIRKNHLAEGEVKPKADPEPEPNREAGTLRTPEEEEATTAEGEEKGEKYVLFSEALDPNAKAFRL